MHDLIIRGGRVIDPESGRDEVSDITVKDKIIVAVGFIDLHGHGQSLPADRMQAFDGVTTSLELELGVWPVARWYDEHAHAGRTLKYGASAGCVLARIAAMTTQQVE